MSARTRANRTTAAGPLDEQRFEEWGRRLGAVAVPASVFVALDGPLGAGKTTLVKAICAGADVEGVVTSPTFTLVQRYGATRPIHHVDLYRIEREADLMELGWDDLTAGDGPVFVEWADRAGSMLPPDRWEIRLSIPDDGRGRTIEAVAHGRVPEIPEVE